MIGNDIIDLEESRKESNWQRKGWIAKVFAAEEQKHIHLTPDPERLVWLMWSMKEAAYKICNRRTRQRFYAPQKFACGNILWKDDGASGAVTFRGARVITRSSISKDFIHTIAFMQNNLVAINVYIRNTAKDKIIPSGRPVYFKDREGIPYRFEGLSGKIKAVSVSHHGRFEAIVF